MCYDLEYLIKESENTSVYLNDRWVPCRPLPFFGIYGLMQKIKDAWLVLIGKADAFKWPENQ